jgi:hypothetical protein
VNIEERKKIKPGTPVVLREDNGELTFTKTCTEPWRLGSGHWVVGVEGKDGGYSLDRITPNAPLIELRGAFRPLINQDNQDNDGQDVFYLPPEETSRLRGLIK